MSKTQQAIELMKGGMSLGDAARKVGIKYPTLYVATAGKKNRERQVAKRRAAKLKKSKRHYSLKEIARRCHLGKDTVRAL